MPGSPKQTQFNPEALFSGNALEVARAIEAGTPARVHALFAADPKVVHATSHGGLTLLAWAAARRHLHGVNMLLNHGADPNVVLTVDGRRFQLLALAAAGSSDALFERLLEAGADPNSQDKGEPAVFAAVHARRWDRVFRLLDAGADINSKSRGGSPLGVYLAKINQYEQVAILLERGADANARDTGGAGLADYVRRFALAADTANGRAHARVRELLRQRGLLAPDSSAPEN